MGGKICNTITEKILHSNSVGSIVERPVDLLMGHDGTAVLAMINLMKIEKIYGTKTELL